MKLQVPGPSVEETSATNGPSQNSGDIHATVKGTGPRAGKGDGRGQQPCPRARPAGPSPPLQAAGSPHSTSSRVTVATAEQQELQRPWLPGDEAGSSKDTSRTRCRAPSTGGEGAPGTLARTPRQGAPSTCDSPCFQPDRRRKRQTKLTGQPAGPDALTGAGRPDGGEDALTGPDALTGAEAAVASLLLA